MNTLISESFGVRGDTEQHFELGYVYREPKNIKINDVVIVQRVCREDEHPTGPTHGTVEAIEIRESGYTWYSIRGFERPVPADRIISVRGRCFANYVN